MSPLKNLAAVLVIVLVALGFALPASTGLADFAGLNSLLWLMLLIFAMQWLGCLQAWRLRSERYFDLVGSLTYITAVAVALWLTPDLRGEKILLALLVLVWAARLGSFLFIRICRAGSDKRFDDIRSVWHSLLLVWTLQGLWVFITLSAVLIALLATDSPAQPGWLALGALLWLLGFATETMADWQKWRFRADPENRARFIDTGLWARSRHPNYAGEIVLWAGLALMAWPLLSGWQQLGLLSPLFVYLLLTRVSGIPLLEAQAQQRWGQQSTYQHYLATTPALWPRLTAASDRRH